MDQLIDLFKVMAENIKEVKEDIKDLKENFLKLNSNFGVVKESTDSVFHKLNAVENGIESLDFPAYTSAVAELVTNVRKSLDSPESKISEENESLSDISNLSDVSSLSESGAKVDTRLLVFLVAPSQ